MTLVLSVQTKDSIWIASDARLSVRGIRPFDEAVKVIEVDDHNVAKGSSLRALVGYAGLGCTVMGNQPSQWVSNVLRGRRFNSQGLIAVLSQAMEKEFPRHLDRIGDQRFQRHEFLISAMIDEKPYVFGIQLANDGGRYKILQGQFVGMSGSAGKRFTPPIILIGSGVNHLAKSSVWLRPLLSLIKKFNQGKISGFEVSDRLAAIVLESHRGTRNGSVGPNCHVLWRKNESSRARDSGYQFYRSAKRRIGPSIPSISNGFDMRAFANKLVPQLMDLSHKAWATEDKDIASKEYRKSFSELIKGFNFGDLPSLPDEKLK